MVKYLIVSFFKLIKSYYIGSSYLVNKLIVDMMNYSVILPYGLTRFKLCLFMALILFACAHSFIFKWFSRKRIVFYLTSILESYDSIGDRLEVAIKILIDSLSKSIIAHSEQIVDQNSMWYLRIISNIFFLQKYSSHSLLDLNSGNLYDYENSLKLIVDKIKDKLKIHRIYNLIYEAKQMFNTIKTINDKLLLLLDEPINLNNLKLRRLFINKINMLIKMKSNLIVVCEEIENIMTSFVNIPNKIIKLNRINEWYDYSLNFSGFVPHNVDQYIGSFLKIVLRYTIDLYLKIAYRCISESIFVINDVLMSTIKCCRLIGITHIDVDGKFMKLDDLCVDKCNDTDDNDEVDTLVYKYYVLFNKLTPLFKDIYCNFCKISIVNSLSSLLNVVLNHMISMIGYLENGLATMIILSLVCIMRCLILINVHYYKNFISHMNIMVNINYLLFIIFIVSLISNGLLNSISKYNSIVILGSGMYVLYVQFVNDSLILKNKFNYKLKLTMCVMILIIGIIWNKIRYIKINQLIPTIQLLSNNDSLCMKSIKLFAFYLNYISCAGDIAYKYNTNIPKFSLSYILNKIKLDRFFDSNKISHDKKTKNSNLSSDSYEPIKIDFKSSFDNIEQTKKFVAIELRNCINLFKSIKNLSLDVEENELKQKLTSMLIDLLEVQKLIDQTELFMTNTLKPLKILIKCDIAYKVFNKRLFDVEDSLEFIPPIIYDIDDVLMSTIKCCRLIGITHIDVDGKFMKLDDLCVDKCNDTDDNDEVDTLVYEYYVLFNKLTPLFKDIYCNFCKISIVNSLSSLLNVVLNHMISMIGYLENGLATMIILSLVCIMRCLILINVHYYKNFISHMNIMVNINYLLFIIFIVSLISNGLLNSISKSNSIVILGSGMYVLYVQFVNDSLILKNKFNYKLKLTMCVMILIIGIIWNKIRYIKINQLILTIQLFIKMYSFAYYNLLDLSYNHNFLLTRTFYNNSKYVQIKEYREKIKIINDIRDKLKSAISFEERSKLNNQLNEISYIEPTCRLVKNFMVNLNLAIDKQTEANSLFTKHKQTANDLFKILNSSNHLSEFTMKETLKQKLKIALKSKVIIESEYNKLKEFSEKFKLKPYKPNINENYNSYDLVVIFKSYIEVSLEYALLIISDINDVLMSTIKCCRLIGITHIDVDGKSMKLDDLCVHEPIFSKSKIDIVKNMNTLLNNVVSFDRWEFIFYMLDPEFAIKSCPINYNWDVY